MSCCSAFGVVCAVVESSCEEMEALDISKLGKPGLHELAHSLYVSGTYSISQADVTRKATP